MTKNATALRLFALALLGGCVLLNGCKSGPKKVKVTGKVTKGGAALEVHQMTGRVQIRLQPLENQSPEPLQAVVKPDGTFTVSGLDGKGILQGKYRICIEQFDPFPTTDKLKGAFTLDKSPFVREVTDSGGHFEIDLDKPA